jgi:hypothetical protein
VIRKSIKAAAPYSSATFNNNNALLVGQNGVLACGPVTTSGTTITIAPPMAFVQQGLIWTSDSPLTVTVATPPPPPYYIAVTTSSPIENLTEVITPTLVKRSQDMAPGTVLVAEWDGQEWRPMPPLSTGGLQASSSHQNMVTDLVGIASGAAVTADSTNIYVGPGSYVAPDGSLLNKAVSTTLPKVAVDADGLDRIDEVVLRKPDDNPVRIGTLQYIVGPTFNSGGTVQLFTPKTVSATATLAPMVLNSPTSDALYILELDGTTLKYYTAPNATTTPTLVGTVATGVSGYTSLLTPDGYIDFIYIKSTTLYYQRISLVGASVYAETSIYASGTTIQVPKMVTVASGTTYFIHCVFEQLVSGAVYNLMYIRLSAANTVETTAAVLVAASSSLHNPSLAKDDDDALLLLAYEDSAATAVYLAQYDASTAAGASPPTQIGTTLTLQNDTYDLTTSTLLASTGAANPMVRRAANKETYVFWRHNKGSSVYGIAVWNDDYINAFGHKAVLKDLYTSGENISQYYVSVDGLGVAHLLLRRTAEADAVNLRLSDMTVSETVQVLASTCTDVYTRFTSRGALVHAYGTSAPGSFIVKSTAGLITTLRDRYLPPTDVYVAHYRNSDGALSVAGTAIEEDPSIRRLYEFGNIFAATGSVTWGGTSTHLLVINAPITIHGFNRSSTYTIAANSPGGIVVPDGSVCFVNLPDADNGATLTLEILPFGQGTLDRYGRTTIPLFWSISGVLYTKFAPYRLESGGETIILGQALTTAERTWLGLPATPDPANHGYSSTLFISQGDDYNTAIGKLDAAVTGSTVLGSVAAVTNGTTSKVVTIGATLANTNYKVSVNWENLTDTNPLYQPLVITAKTTTTFTVSWNLATDSANYSLDWLVVA